MRISDWISDVCSSDLTIARGHQEAMRADGPEMTFGRRLHRHQPAQTSQSRFDHGRRERCGARDDQRLRQPGVVLAEAIFEPCPFGTFLRSEERRVGKECVSTCRSRWAPSLKKKK